LIYKKRHFTKTGSGQKYGKGEKRVAFFAGGGVDQGLAAAVAGGEALGTAGLNASSLTLLYEWE
jgi:hypothetical protein